MHTGACVVVVDKKIDGECQLESNLTFRSSDSSWGQMLRGRGKARMAGTHINVLDNRDARLSIYSSLIDVVSRLIWAASTPEGASFKS